LAATRCIAGTSLDQVEGMSGSRPNETTPDVERPHVLIVDEEPLMRWFLAEIASEAGYRTTQLCNIDEALHFVHESPGAIAVVLVDCPHTFADLPQVAALRQLMPACWLALMTSFSTSGFLDQALMAGASQVLHKPFDVSDVVSLFVGIDTATAIGRRSSAFWDGVASGIDCAGRLGETQLASSRASAS